jgi:GNAT superfamily N-acetyltransferase
VLHADGGLRIRRAGPADIDSVARLGLEIIRFDSRFAAVNERADSLDALRREAAGLVAGWAPWTWLAERGGEPVAMLAAQRPEAAGWITPMTGPAPAAYLMLMFVQPGERGTGVGAALVDQFHREADAAGVAVTLLHHAQLNPLSAPFWSRHGYRPLWTTWQAAPARAIRLPGRRQGRSGVALPLRLEEPRLQPEPRHEHQEQAGGDDADHRPALPSRRPHQ